MMINWASNAPAPIKGSIPSRSLNLNSVGSFPLAIFKTIEAPSPINKLNIGPAKHPVNAILASPCLATAALTLKSAILSPAARIVIPKKVGSSSIIKPNKLIRSTRHPAMKNIHIIDTKNHSTVKKIIALFGGLFRGVVKNVKIAISSATPSLM